MYQEKTISYNLNGEYFFSFFHSEPRKTFLVYDGWRWQSYLWT